MKLEFIKKGFVIISYLAVLSLGISACYHGYPDQLFSSLHPEQYDIEGQWVDANGITSFFYNGIFETRSADTDEKLAEGNYALHMNRTIDIEIRSLVRGTISHVNCSHVNRSSLVCSSDSGAQFTLTKTLL